MKISKELRDIYASCPFGYYIQSITYNLKIHNERIPIVKNIFNDYLNGLSLEQIKDNANNSLGYMFHDEFLTVDDIEEILIDTRYIGYFYCDGIKYPYESIIDEYTFRTVENLININKEKRLIDEQEIEIENLDPDEEPAKLVESCKENKKQDINDLRYIDRILIIKNQPLTKYRISGKGKYLYYCSKNREHYINETVLEDEILNIKAELLNNIKDDTNKLLLNLDDDSNNSTFIGYISKNRRDWFIFSKLKVDEVKQILIENKEYYLTGNSYTKVSKKCAYNCSNDILVVIKGKYIKLSYDEIKQVSNKLEEVNNLLYSLKTTYKTEFRKKSDWYSEYILGDYKNYPLTVIRFYYGKYILTIKAINSLEKSLENSHMKTAHVIIFTTSNDISAKVKELIEEKSYEVYVDKLPVIINFINEKYSSIKSLFESEHIPDFSKLPNNAESILKFASDFYAIYDKMYSARIQGFTWEDEKLKLSKATYDVLFARYKEIERKMNDDPEVKLPFNLMQSIHSTKLKTIDSNYLESKFHKYLLMLNIENSSKKEIDDALDELHRLFLTLSPEKQKVAEDIIFEIRTGSLVLDKDKTLNDYINERLLNTRETYIQDITKELGLDIDKLNKIMSLGKNETNINAFGMFDDVWKTVDIEKTKLFLENITGIKLSKFELINKGRILLKSFILEEGFNINDKETVLNKIK